MRCGKTSALQPEYGTASPLFGIVTTKAGVESRSLPESLVLAEAHANSVSSKERDALIAEVISRGVGPLLVRANDAHHANDHPSIRGWTPLMKASVKRLEDFGAFSMIVDRTSMGLEPRSEADLNWNRSNEIRLRSRRLLIFEVPRKQGRA